MSESASAPIFRILLVEDAPDQSLLLSALLQKLGPFEVALSQDGVQALERAREGAFDLVITDLNLPGMDGFELTRRIKATLPSLPVLATTGYSDPSYVEGAYRAGVDALMSKPIDPEDLEARLRELLPRWRGDDGERPVAVLAVGGRPGDVWIGCGASLIAHRSTGHEVVMAVLATGDERETEHARTAAEHVGVRLVSPPGNASAADIDVARAMLERVVAEVRPGWGYIPSPADRDRSRHDVHAIARAALASIPTLLAYPTPTASLAFTPAVYRDVGRWMDAKAEVLALLSADPRGAYSPEFGRAQARYWGRFKDFAEVEPFEHLDRTGRRSRSPLPPPVVPPPPPATPGADVASRG